MPNARVDIAAVMQNTTTRFGAHVDIRTLRMQPEILYDGLLAGVVDASFQQQWAPPSG